jgi:Rrf2 family protein
MKLSRTVAYAVRATLQLAQQPSETPIPCSKLASDGNMPERFLLQILRSLVTHGILRSTRGVDGGYALTRPPEEISLLDIIEAIEGPMDTGDRSGNGLPVESQERLHVALRQITDIARQQLESIKFSQLLEPPTL